MRKKILLEKRQALRSEAAGLLTAEQFNQTRADEITAELANVETELDKVERLEQQIAAANVSRGGVTVHNNAEDRPWNNMGEFFSAVVRAGESGRSADPRLQALAASGANEGISSDGGFLVTPEFSSELLKLTFETGVLASRCRNIPVTGNTMTFNAIDETSRVNGSRYGGIQVYRVAEAGTVDAKKPQFKQVSLKLKKMMGLCYATDELLEDSTALGAVISEAFPAEFGYMIDQEIISGNGVGQFLGYMNSPALVTASKKANQTAATIVGENLHAMYSRLPRSSRQNAVWLINQDVEPQLPFMTIGNMPVYLPAGSLAGSPEFGTLLGRPVIPIEQAETLGTVGDIHLVDLSQYFIITKGGLKSDSSMHVRFLYGENTFRFTLRNDGAPRWSSALTPAKGSNTLSPFVVLETRS